MLLLTWLASKLLGFLLAPPAAAAAAAAAGKDSSGATASDAAPIVAAAAPSKDALLPLAPSQTLVVIAEIVLPSHADTQGICFGGQILSWIDLCAGIAAKKLARNACVTASVDSVQFLKPSKVGDVIILSAMVNRTFNTSMEIGVRVETECMRTGERKYCCSAYLTFVSINSSGKPSAVRQVLPETDDERRRFDQALHRRQARLSNRALEARTALELNCFDDGHSMAAAGTDSDSPSQTKLVKETVAHTTQVVLPGHANTVGVTFGGDIMAWMERCAYISASRLCRRIHILSAAVDSLHFINATRVGDIVYITSMVTASFNSSMEVMISVYGENPVTGEIRHCNDAFMTLVAVDETGKPLPVSTVEPESELERQRNTEAFARRNARLQARHKLRRNSNEFTRRGSGMLAR